MRQQTESSSVNPVGDDALDWRGQNRGKKRNGRLDKSWARPDRLLIAKPAPQ